MGSGAAVMAAAKQPELVSGLVLVGPFVRNGASGAMQRIMLRAAMAPLWAAASWKAYMPKLYAGQRPVDFDDHRDRVVASLRRPGYAKAFSLTTRTNHDPAEASWLADALHGEVVMVADAGHYPQSQRPDVVTPAVVTFLSAVRAHG
jgi:pimeloyl-ACP methyl ester carboxylesterase